MSSRYRTTALIVCDLARKMVQILGFSAPVRFKGHFEEIGIAKVLLNTKKATSCGKVSGMSVFRRLRKCGERKKEKKETAVKYNGSLALAIARAGDHNYVRRRRYVKYVSATSWCAMASNKQLPLG